MLKDESFNKEIKEQLKSFMKTNENEDTTVQNHWDAAKAVPREKMHCNTNIHPKIGKNSNTKANLTLKGPGEKNSK